MHPLRRLGFHVEQLESRLLLSRFAPLGPAADLLTAQDSAAEIGSFATSNDRADEPASVVVRNEPAQEAERDANNSAEQTPADLQSPTVTESTVSDPGNSAIEPQIESSGTGVATPDGAAVATALPVVPSDPNSETTQQEPAIDGGTSASRDAPAQTVIPTVDPVDTAESSENEASQQIDNSTTVSQPTELIEPIDQQLVRTPVPVAPEARTETSRQPDVARVEETGSTERVDRSAETVAEISVTPSSVPTRSDSADIGEADPANRNGQTTRDGGDLVALEPESLPAREDDTSVSIDSNEDVEELSDQIRPTGPIDTQNEKGTTGSTDEEPRDEIRPIEPTDTQNEEGTTSNTDDESQDKMRSPELESEADANQGQDARDDSQQPENTAANEQIAVSLEPQTASSDARQRDTVPLADDVERQYVTLAASNAPVASSASSNESLAAATMHSNSTLSDLSEWAPRSQLEVDDSKSPIAPLANTLAASLFAVTLSQPFNRPVGNGNSESTPSRGPGDSNTRDWNAPIARRRRRRRGMQLGSLRLDDGFPFRNAEDPQSRFGEELSTAWADDQQQQAEKIDLEFADRAILSLLESPDRFESETDLHSSGIAGMVMFDSEFATLLAGLLTAVATSAAINRSNRRHRTRKDRRPVVRISAGPTVLDDR